MCAELAAVAKKSRESLKFNRNNHAILQKPIVPHEVMSKHISRLVKHYSKQEFIRQIFLLSILLVPQELQQTYPPALCGSHKML